MFLPGRRGVNDTGLMKTLSVVAIFLQISSYHLLFNHRFGETEGLFPMVTLSRNNFLHYKLAIMVSSLFLTVVIVFESEFSV